MSWLEIATNILAAFIAYVKGKIIRGNASVLIFANALPAQLINALDKKINLFEISCGSIFELCFFYTKIQEKVQILKKLRQTVSELIAKNDPLVQSVCIKLEKENSELEKIIDIEQMSGFEMALQVREFITGNKDLFEQCFPNENSWKQIIEIWIWKI